MLVLSRRIGECLIIGDDVRLTVLGVGERGSGHVRIGVSAPRAVAVWREEVYERIRADGEDDQDHTRETSSRASAPIAVV